MAQQLLGRSIQTTFIFISRINSLLRPQPLTSPPRVFLNPFPQKFGFPQGQCVSPSRSLLSTATFQRTDALIQEEDKEFDSEDEEDYEDEDEDEYENNEVNEEEKVVVSVKHTQPSNPARRIPDLTVKEKKELGAYAHSLGKKLKCQQVGKSGVTSSIATSISDALEANELLKLKVHNTCPEELDVVASQLQEATQSLVVGQIGRTLILYRPSLRKTAAAEKKKPPQRVQRSRVAKSARWKNRRA